MKPVKTLLSIILVLLVASCSKKNTYEKGFRVGPTSVQTETEDEKGLNNDSLNFETRPGDVLLTGISNLRLTPVYKVNYNRDNNSTFTGSNLFYSSYYQSEEISNWDNNLMPGIEAVYGYNMVNVSLFDLKDGKIKNLFDKPVLIRTIYYPAFSNDSIKGKPVLRQYFMISAYNEDTNKDGFINLKDLRRFYLFDTTGTKKKPLVPENYSVFKSAYDWENDLMYVYAQLDTNSNGNLDKGEPVHVFWIDLNNPEKSGRQY
ncbi:MAG: hypothetical protein U0W24_26590 [Bacteroidales bacterium]